MQTTIMSKKNPGFLARQTALGSELAFQMCSSRSRALEKESQSEGNHFRFPKKVIDSSVKISPITLERFRWPPIHGLCN